MNEDLQSGSMDQENGQITYANEVISTIVSVATTEVEGISGISGGGSISGIIAKGKIPRGVKVTVNGNLVSVDISVTVDYGIPIQKVGKNCQENVRKSIESMTGLKVERVDLHVVGVSFDKENKELQQSQSFARKIEDEEAAEEKKEAPAASLIPEETPAEPEKADEPENAKSPAEELNDTES